MIHTLWAALPWALVLGMAVFTILYIRRHNLMTIELTDDQQAQITAEFTALKQKVADAAGRVLAAKSAPADIGPVLTAISDLGTAIDAIAPPPPVA